MGSHRARDGARAPAVDAGFFAVLNAVRARRRLAGAGKAHLTLAMRVGVALLTVETRPAGWPPAIDVAFTVVLSAIRAGRDLTDEADARVAYAIRVVGTS